MATGLEIAKLETGRISVIGVEKEVILKETARTVPGSSADMDGVTHDLQLDLALAGAGAEVIAQAAVTADRDLLQREIEALSETRGQGALGTGALSQRGGVHLHPNQGSAAQRLKTAGLKKESVLMFIKENSQSTAKAPGRRAEALLVLKGIALWRGGTEALLMLMGEVAARVRGMRGVL